MRGLRLLALGSVLAACGCGGSPNSTSNGWGGLSEYDASTAAQDVLGQEVGNPQSLLYDRHLVIRKVAHGKRPGGGQAWLVRLETLAAHRANPTCIWIWGSNVAFRTTYDYDVARCPASGSV